MKTVLISLFVVLLLGMFLTFSGIGLVLFLSVAEAWDREFSSGIEIVNDTDAVVRVRSERNGFGYFAGTYCHNPMRDAFWCPVSELQAGDDVVQSHGKNNQGDQVRFLVPVDWEDYHEVTGEVYRASGKTLPEYQLRDETPQNYGNIQESSFLCYLMDLSDAEVRQSGLPKRKILYSYRWSDVLEHPSSTSECGSRI